MEQTDTTKSFQGHDTAGTSGSSSKSLAGAGKPVGVVAPQKRDVANGAAGAGTIRPGGAVAAAAAPTTPVTIAAAGVLGGQGNEVAQQPPALHPLQSQGSAQAGPQQATQSQVPADVAQQRNRTPVSDSEKRKLIQQQLLLFLHAWNCQRRENQAGNGEQWQPCTLPYCRTMKDVLIHMSTCNAGKNCTRAHCSSSRQIIGHWRHCVRADCPVCLPVKHQAENLHATAARELKIQLRLYDNVTVPVPSEQTGAQRRISELKRQAHVLSVPPPTLLVPVSSEQASAQQSFSELRRYALDLSTPLQPEASAATQGTSPTDAAMVNQQVEASVIPTNIQEELFGNLNDAGQSGSGLMNDSSRSSNMQLSGGLQPEQVAATPVQATKEWHQNITPDLRNHLVHKLVKAIFPNPNPQAMVDRRMRNLVSYARKAEGDMYETANSRSEYYHLIAEKIYVIQRELEEKRRQRYREQQQLQAQQQQSTASGASNPIVPSKMMGNVSKPIGAVQPTRRIQQVRQLYRATPITTRASVATRQLPTVNGATIFSPGSLVITENECREILRARAVRAQASLQGQQASTSLAVATAQAGPSSAPSEPSSAPSNDSPQATTSTSSTQSSHEARKFSINKCIQALVHACQCKDVNCELGSCQRMKRVVMHIKTCKRRTSGGCQICKQLVALCCHHARHCPETKCSVPFCHSIKQKLKQQQHRQRLQWAKLLRQKSAIFKTRGRRPL